MNLNQCKVSAEICPKIQKIVRKKTWSSLLACFFCGFELVTFCCWVVFWFSEPNALVQNNHGFKTPNGTFTPWNCFNKITNMNKLFKPKVTNEKQSLVPNLWFKVLCPKDLLFNLNLLPNLRYIIKTQPRCVSF